MARSIHSRGLLSGGFLLPCMLLITALSASAGSAAITPFTGGDSGEGLDLSGNYLYAVNVNKPSGFTYTVQGLTFTSEADTPGVTISPQAPVTGTVTYGATADDLALNSIMTTIRYAPNSHPDVNLLTVDYDVIPGYNYRLQLLLDCTAYQSRHQDIMVNGTMVADNLFLQMPSPKGKGPGTLVSYDYMATSNSTHVALGPTWMDGDSPLGGDNNPVINALTVQQLPGNTVGYWRLDDGSPGTAATAVDSMFNNGALQGTASDSPVFNADTPEGTIVDGLYGPDLGPSATSLQFTSTDSVFIPFDQLLEPDQFTIEFFMKAGEQDTYPGIVQKRKQIGGGEITWGVGKESNEYAFARVDTTTTTNATWTIPGSTDDGEWHHFALTYEEVAGNGVWTLYRDYTLVAVKTNVGLIDYDGLSGLYFGDAPTDFKEYIGLLDEVRFSDVVLTPSQFLHAIPEPSSIVLLACGCLLMLALSKRRRRRK